MTLPPNIEEPMPASTPSTRIKSGIAGAVLGVGALVGTMALVAGAGAQSGDVDAGEQGEVIATSSAGEGLVAGVGDDELDAFFTCVDDVFETALAGEDAGLAEAEVDALFESAEAEAENCESELPEGVDIEMLEADFDEADVDDWDDVDFDEYEIPEVVVETADGLELIDFGDGDGSVTITKTGDEITVSVEGDATSEAIDWADIEEFELEELDEDELDEDELDEDELEEIDEDELDEEEGADDN